VDQVVVEPVNQEQLVDVEQLVKEMLEVRVTPLKADLKLVLVVEALAVWVNQEHPVLQNQMVELV
tara:strand:+ start:443 stop:637 length:195 start_codon:yes stop_codon:yes gene_type:complete